MISLSLSLSPFLLSLVITVKTQEYFTWISHRHLTFNMAQPFLAPPFNLLLHAVWWDCDFSHSSHRTEVQKLSWTPLPLPANTLPWHVRPFTATGCSQILSLPVPASPAHLLCWADCCFLNMPLLWACSPTAPSARNDLSSLLHSAPYALGLQSGVIISRKPTLAPPWDKLQVLSALLFSTAFIAREYKLLQIGLPPCFNSTSLRMRTLPCPSVTGP